MPKCWHPQWKGRCRRCECIKAIRGAIIRFAVRVGLTKIPNVNRIEQMRLSNETRNAYEILRQYYFHSDRISSFYLSPRFSNVMCNMTQSVICFWCIFKQEMPHLWKFVGLYVFVLRVKETWCMCVRYLVGSNVKIIYLYVFFAWQCERVCFGATYGLKSMYIRLLPICWSNFVANISGYYTVIV